jgi:alpha-tubulin suppressor-like RCC1 family protein
VRHIAADSTSVVAVGRDGAEAKRLGGKRLDAQLDAMERYGEAAKAPPKPLDAVAVAAITCGVEHSVALERSGHVWTSVAATIFERFRGGTTRRESSPSRLVGLDVARAAAPARNRRARVLGARDRAAPGAGVGRPR